MDPWLIVGGLLVGVVVGLTGMGGGALMTPMLMFFFHVNPLAAVSSDLVTTAVMKPFGGAVHARHGALNRRMVLWLAMGSIPSAFAGVLILRALGGGSRLDDVVSFALGIALLVAAVLLVVKAWIALRERAHGAIVQSEVGVNDVEIRPILTVLVGVLGGLVVGMTSVGSGSLIIVLLLLVYPTLQSSRLVGTDLVQAVPLVAAAALGHLLFGDFQLGISLSLIVGSVPGVILGAYASSRAPGGVIRRVLVIVLFASSLKLLHVSTPVVAITLVLAVVFGPPAWMAARKAYGLPAIAWKERQEPVSV